MTITKAEQKIDALLVRLDAGEDPKVILRECDEVGRWLAALSCAKGGNSKRVVRLLREASNLAILCGAPPRVR